MTALARSGLALVGLAVMAACGSTNPAGRPGVDRGERSAMRGAIDAVDVEWHWGWRDPATYDARRGTYNEKVSALSADNPPMAASVPWPLRPGSRGAFRPHAVAGLDAFPAVPPPPAIAARKESPATDPGRCPDGEAGRSRRQRSRSFAGDCPRMTCCRTHPVPEQEVAR